ncbi:AraC family transcriptional regulator [Paraburkholderia sp. BCC1885]|uniref:AraC family transcriptional regulator n=1 Tax=Paraburkholderia sp. BCC1885 TaxID=2562669 RepID=UPI0011842FD1|nr:AraC family transcriptional regulator [Paraburkholderia sp. BCC1885]
MGEILRPSGEKQIVGRAILPGADWHAVLGNVYGLESQSDRSHTEPYINILDTGELTIADVRMADLRLVPQEQPGRKADQILIKHIVHGTVVFEQNGKQGCVRAGALVVVDPSWPFTEQVDEQVRMVVMGCPKSALRQRGNPSSLKQWVEADSDSPDVQLFLGISSLLMQYRGAARDTTIVRLASQLLDMADITLLGKEGRYGLKTREAALFRIERYINERLADSTLDAAKIANDVNLSIGYLNHLFREQGTSLMRYVWQQRIKHAYDLLTKPACRTMPIDEIAWNCGFSSPAHFSRKFKQSYGLNPRAMRTLAYRPHGDY